MNRIQALARPSLRLSLIAGMASVALLGIITGANAATPAIPNADSSTAPASVVHVSGTDAASTSFYETSAGTPAVVYLPNTDGETIHQSSGLGGALPALGNTRTFHNGKATGGFALGLGN